MGWHRAGEPKPMRELADLCQFAFLDIAEGEACRLSNFGDANRMPDHQLPPAVLAHPTKHGLHM